MNKYHALYIIGAIIALLALSVTGYEEVHGHIHKGYYVSHSL